MSNENNKDILSKNEDIKETPMDNTEKTNEAVETSEAVEFEDEPIIENMDDLGDKFTNSISEIKKKENKTGKFKKSTFMKAIIVGFLALVPLVSYIAYDEAIAQVNLEHKTMIDKIFEKKVPKELIDEYKPTILNVGFDKTSNTLTYDLEQASIKLSNYFIHINNDTIKNWSNTELNVIEDSFNEKIEQSHGKHFIVRSIDVYKDRLYINYMNSTGTAIRDILIDDFIMTSGLDINDMKSLDNRLYEHTEDTMVMSFVEGYDDSFIFYSEEIAHGKLATKTLSNRINDTEKAFRFTPVKDVENENVIINLDGVGKLELDKLTNFKEAPGIYLSTIDGVLRLYNYKDDEAYAFITYINNVNFMCEASNLLNTNYDNLFICNGFDDKESVGYRTFAIKGSEDQLYVFRVLEVADEQLLIDILNTFGIEKDKIEVEVVQETVDVEHVDGVNDDGAETSETEDTEAEDVGTAETEDIEAVEEAEDN